MLGGVIRSEILSQTDPSFSKTATFNQYSLVAPQQCVAKNVQL